MKTTDRGNLSRRKGASRIAMTVAGVAISACLTGCTVFPPPHPGLLLPRHPGAYAPAGYGPPIGPGCAPVAPLCCPPAPPVCYPPIQPVCWPAPTSYAPYATPPTHFRSSYDRPHRSYTDCELLGYNGSGCGGTPTFAAPARRVVRRGSVQGSHHRTYQRSYEGHYQSCGEDCVGDCGEWMLPEGVYGVEQPYDGVWESDYMSMEEVPYGNLPYGSLDLAPAPPMEYLDGEMMPQNPYPLMIEPEAESDSLPDSDAGAPMEQVSLEVTQVSWTLDDAADGRTELPGNHFHTGSYVAPRRTPDRQRRQSVK